MKNESLTIPCSDIRLEAQIHLPDGPGPCACVVICHPHPLYGGDMNNNVVMALAEALMARSIAALRFNFRGVGGSGGVYGGGTAEKKDIAAVYDYLEKRTEINKRRLGLAGYSFGGAVAADYATGDKRVKALALVSPALQADAVSIKTNLNLPRIVLAGSLDAVVPAGRLKRLFEGDKNCIMVAGADHFWQGFEGQLQSYIGDFFEANLKSL